MVPKETMTGDHRKTRRAADDDVGEPHNATIRIGSVVGNEAANGFGDAQDFLKCSKQGIVCPCPCG